MKILDQVTQIISQQFVDIYGTVLHNYMIVINKINVKLTGLPVIMCGRKY